MKRVASITLPLLLIIAIVLPSFAEEPAVAPTPKEWTLAVFLNGDNNLDPFGIEDMKEMSAIGSNDWLNMVVLMDRENGPAALYYIEKGNIKKLKDMGELDMGDYRQLIGFARLVARDFPAKRYILGIWNHGSGWKNAAKKVFRGISYDDQSGNHITTAQLGIALREIKGIFGHNIDILNFDACLMQMAEVVYVCRGSVDYIVASEEVEPGKGTPYDDVFKHLTATIKTDTFVKAWVKAFVSSYSGGSQGIDDCTQSGINVAAMEGVYDAINGFAKAAMGGKFNAQFAQALQQVQRFAYPENVDLIHLATLLKGSITETGMQTACGKLIGACQTAIIANGSNGAGLRNAKGLAIYLPHDYYLESGYTNLEFAKATMWDEMILDLGKKSIAAALVASVESGDLSELRKFVANAAEQNPDVTAFVIQELNFRLYSEGGLPASLVEEVRALLAQLQGSVSPSGARASR
ncbi:MAG: Clostripain [Candidatus Ozemobacter sibiricus]|jgi:hypothetical protein|uniref:Clostripain n=1 Tax=Candidatus Ozemobacter sibiricus TaxID=2268124 RepID=A0A367ZQM3_9BACT|nr:MAG: Clostripain [Candidatus Ozemobacter sibiricus]